MKTPEDMIRDVVVADPLTCRGLVLNFESYVERWCTVVSVFARVRQWKTKAEIGSRWAGEPSDSVDVLLARLAKYALDPTFEEYGNFIPSPGRFWGNFAELSSVFAVETDDPALVAKLTAATRANQATPAYAAAKQGRAKFLAYWAKQEAGRQEQARRWRS